MECFVCYKRSGEGGRARSFPETSGGGVELDLRVGGTHP